MKSHRGKSQTEAVPAKPFSIEKYNSRTDRRTSQNGSLAFSAFVFTVVFVLVMALGYAISGRFDVWAVVSAFLLACLAVMSIHIALQWEKVVVLRFGKFSRTKGPGLYFTIPFIEQTALKADQRIMVTGFGAEETLTSDLVPINVDAVLFWMVWDAEKACLEVENYYNSVSLAAQTALRDAIGRASVSEVAIRRNQLDQELQEVIEERTSTWGITILSVEIRDIVIPQELQEVMSAEAQAEREKNARMVLAEVEEDISEMLVKAANVYEKNDVALRLRTMHLLYESVKGSGGTVVIPSAYSEGFSDAALDHMADSLKSSKTSGSVV
ncbi:slipin family protein [Eggerthella sp. YY7918]|uniref:slipin family protein n=1 Tax=Eggerthella sp. (strain YY7918) TaxID=502558 RepID=UPI0002171488|nr:slipin family protein [Eggerthella sp. YY7918]BAK45414.1 membrane protease subunit [Eggerthella sp. YY7918]